LLADLLQVRSDPRMQRLLIEQAARERRERFGTDPPDPASAVAAPANRMN
jgi:hypothetical protein